MGQKVIKFVSGVTQKDLPAPTVSMNKIDWDDLRFFVAIDRERSLRRAAAKLGVKAPTVRRRIESLEASLGMQLFFRTPHGFVLSESGKRVAKHAEKVEGLIQNTASQLACLDGNVDGECKVLMSVGVASLWFMPHFLQKLVTRHPKIVLRLLTPEEGQRPRFPLLDMEIRTFPSSDPEMRSERIATFHLMYFASKDYLRRHGAPKTADDLANHRTVDILTAGYAGSSVLSEFSNSSALGKATVVTNSGNLISQAIQAGVCIGPLPSYTWLVIPDLVPLLLPTSYPIGLFLSYTASSVDRPEVSAVRDFLTETVFDQTNMPWFAEAPAMPNETWREVFSRLVRTN